MNNYKKSKSEKVYFKVDTMKLLNEIVECSLPVNAGILKVPLNVFRIYLGKVSERAIELNDPILNMLMVDMVLYEMPEPNTKEYRNIYDKVKKTEQNFIKISNFGNGK